jgi:hypothetical protein
MKEILRSYQLLFRENKKSRKLYCHRERNKAVLNGKSNPDPVLDKVCGWDDRSSIWDTWKPARETFHPEAHFPILRHRLEAIQNYMDGIEPNRMFSVWRDRRDLRVWVTIWVVILLGFIGIILNVVSIAISAAQLKAAQDSLQLQRADEE